MATKKDEPQVGQDSAEDPKVTGAKLANEDKSVAGGRPYGHIVTSAPKREPDKTSYPTGGEAHPDDPPVRAARPDTAIGVSLATGAGEHVPPDPDDYTPEGRPR